MKTKELWEQIKEQVDIATENHIEYSFSGNKSAAKRTRVALSSLKKLITPYKKASMSEVRDE